MERLDDIVDHARLFAGMLDERQDTALQQLCAAAEQRLQSRLRPGQEAACYDSFVCAAAWMALADLEMLRNMENISEFTAGHLTVKRGSSSGAVSCLRTQAEMLMAPYVSDSLIFRRV